MLLPAEKDAVMVLGLGLRDLEFRGLGLRVEGEGTCCQTISFIHRKKNPA